MPHSLLSTLSSGPLDIVGDVHGEIDPLLSLMHHLGYDEHGSHPDNRKLVFVGDLTDRGPDSLAVVNLVQALTERQHAQCVLGNQLGDRRSKRSGSPRGAGISRRPAA